MSAISVHPCACGLSDYCDCTDAQILDSRATAAENMAEQFFDFFVEPHSSDEDDFEIVMVDGFPVIMPRGWFGRSG